MTNIFLLSWDMQGLETCIDVSSLDKERMWNILQDKPTDKNLHDIVTGVILRARFNSQRHYEVYTVYSDPGITADDIRQMFENDPQGSAELIRERGTKIHSDRIESKKVLIS